MWEYKHLLISLLSILWYLPRILTAGSYGDPMINFIVFSTAVSQFYIPNSKQRGLNFYPILPILAFSSVLLFANSHHNRYEGYIYGSLGFVMLNTFSCIHWLFVYHLWRNTYSSPCLFLN